MWGEQVDDQSLQGSTTETEIVCESSPRSDESRGYRNLNLTGIRYRTTYVQHPSTYTSRLYDVNGRLLLTPTGKFANVMSLEFKEMLDKKQVRCIHNVRHRPGYRYFISSKAQQETFTRARDTGLSYLRTPYHIYPDEPGVVLPFQVADVDEKTRRYVSTR